MKIINVFDAFEAKTFKAHILKFKINTQIFVCSG